MISLYWGGVNHKRPNLVNTSVNFSIDTILVIDSINPKNDVYVEVIKKRTISNYLEVISGVGTTIVNVGSILIDFKTIVNVSFEDAVVELGNVLDLFIHIVIGTTNSTVLLGIIVEAEIYNNWDKKIVQNHSRKTKGKVSSGN